eukprot:268290_1
MSSSSSESEIEYESPPQSNRPTEALGLKTTSGRLVIDVSKAKSKENAFQEEEHKLQGDDVHLKFTVSDGRKIQGMFKMGQNVEYIKAFLEAELTQPYESMELFLADQLMADPLSLNDFPSIQSKTPVEVLVKGGSCY